MTSIGTTCRERDIGHAIDSAIEAGAEVFFIDASWYAAPESSWGKTVDDWDVSLQHFPKV